MMNLIDNNQMSLASIGFSDESTFTLHGEVNRHNGAVVIFGLTITLIGCQKHIYSFHKKVNAWARIIR
jgi:hypothetical protein